MLDPWGPRWWTGGNLNAGPVGAATLDRWGPERSTRGGRDDGQLWNTGDHGATPACRSGDLDV